MTTARICRIRVRQRRPTGEASTVEANTFFSTVAAITINAHCEHKQQQKNHSVVKQKVSQKKKQKKKNIPVLDELICFAWSLAQAGGFTTVKHSNQFDFIVNFCFANIIDCV